MRLPPRLGLFENVCLVVFELLYTFFDVIHSSVFVVLGRSLFILWYEKQHHSKCNMVFHKIQLNNNASFASLVQFSSVQFPANHPRLWLICKIQFNEHHHIIIIKYNSYKGGICLEEFLTRIPYVGNFWQQCHCPPAFGISVWVVRFQKSSVDSHFWLIKSFKIQRPKCWEIFEHLWINLGAAFGDL